MILKMNLLFLIFCFVSGNINPSTDSCITLAATLPLDEQPTALLNYRLNYPKISEFLAAKLKKLEHLRDTLLNVHYALWRSG